MVKTLPSKAEGEGSISGQRAKIPGASGPKNKNIKRSNIATNSVKTFKMVHISLKKKKERKKER